LWPNGSFTGGIWPRYETWNTSAGYLYADVPSSGKVHTGTHSVAIPSSRNGIEYEPNVAKLDPTKAYRASVWTTSPQAGIYYVVDNNAVTVPGKAERTINGWYLLTLDIPPIGTGHSYMRVGVWNGLSQTLYADDFRFQPANAQVNSYVYDQENGRLTDILDNDNLATHYEYDAVGRLVKVYKESFQYGRQLVSEKRFNYARNQKFTIQASLSGGGQLASSLSGGLTNQLELGGEVRYTVSGTSCQDKFELSAANTIAVDGINITTDQRLADGTLVRRLPDGCLLSNTRGAHSVILRTQHYNYDPYGTKYDIGCEQNACGGYTGYMLYKIADGCGGLLPATDGQYYTRISTSCRASGIIQPTPCDQAATHQPYEKQLNQVKTKATKATKAQVESQSFSTKAVSSKR
jgi:YD repeat-containing protein